MGYYWKGWLLTKEFDRFEELCPWGIEILERWIHDDPNMYGGMEAIGFEVYAEEGKEAFHKFFDYFDALMDGMPSQTIRARETKWKKIMASLSLSESSRRLAGR